MHKLVSLPLHFGINFKQSMRIVFMFFIGSLFAGCGYQLQGSGTVLPKDIKTVAVAPVENRTTETGLGPRFSEELRSRFDRYGAISVIDNPEQADAVLTAKIIEIDTTVSGVTSSTDIAQELRLAMTIWVELKRQNGQLLWRDPALVVSSSFAGTSDVVVTSSASFAQGDIGTGTLDSLGTEAVSRGQEETAINNLLEEASKQIYLAAVAEDF